jgi:hypothetical protein
LGKPQLPILSTIVTAKRMTWSATRKKMALISTITNTIAVVINVSRRDGQVTFSVSERTSCKNLNGLTIVSQTVVVCPTVKDETGNSGSFFGIKIAAEVRHRAASEFSLPTVPAG